MARIAPLSPPYADDVGATLARMTPPGVEPIALFRLFGRNPAMAEAMTGWGSYELGRHLSLTRRDREIVIDRTAARCGCEYEWGVHVAHFATKVGFTAEQVTSLTHGRATDPCWTDERDRLLIEAADSLHDDHDIDDALWARLAGTFDEPQLIDLILLAGWYHAISYAALATRLPPEPGTPSFSDVAPRSVSGI